MAAIGASPSLPVFWGMSLHRTDSGHSPWQREPLFVPPLALDLPRFARVFLREPTKLDQFGLGRL